MDGKRPWYRRPLPLIGSILGLIVLGFIGYIGFNMVKYIYLMKSGKIPQGLTLEQISLLPDAETILSATHPSDSLISTIESGVNPTLGNPSAKVKIVEFVDYDCPFCQRTANVMREFMAKHADDAYLILRDFPIEELHPATKDISVAARCAFLQSQDKYWVFHDMLYENLSARTPDALALMAQRAGLDMQAFNQCVSSKQTLPEVDKSYADAVSAGGRGTPTFFFNGHKVDGAMDADHFEAMFQAAVQLAEQN